MPAIIGDFVLNKNAPIRRGMQVADAAGRLALDWVWDGFIVFQVDTQKYYKCDVDEKTLGGGPPWTIEGDWTIDPHSVAGADGADGTVWYEGGADPNDGTGVNGDFFIQSADGSTYLKGDMFQKAGKSVV